jgi:hypothetical protein
MASVHNTGKLKFGAKENEKAKIDTVTHWKKLLMDLGNIYNCFKTFTNAPIQHDLGFLPSPLC